MKKKELKKFERRLLEKGLVPAMADKVSGYAKKFGKTAALAYADGYDAYTLAVHRVDSPTLDYGDPRDETLFGKIAVGFRDGWLAAEVDGRAGKMIADPYFPTVADYRGCRCRNDVAERCAAAFGVAADDVSRLYGEYPMLDPYDDYSAFDDEIELDWYAVAALEAEVADMVKERTEDSVEKSANTPTDSLDCI